METIQVRGEVSGRFGGTRAVAPVAEVRPWRHAITTARGRKREEPPRFRSAFEILRGLDLFAPVSDGELLKFATLGRERRVERHHAVTPEPGRRESPLALILEGDAVLAWGRGSEDLFLRALESGDLVGEIDLFARLPRADGFSSSGHGTLREPAPFYETGNEGERRREARAGGGGREPSGDATARALTTVRLIEWDRDAVREALRRWPDVALCLLGGMARRQRDMHRRIAGLCRQRAPRRLARALGAMLEERGIPYRDEAGRRGLLLPRTPSRARLSEIAGMARETVSRLLADWERRGWIDTRRRDLLVLDGGAWRRLAGAEA